jgi:hypothetical protein
VRVEGGIEHGERAEARGRDEVEVGAHRRRRWPSGGVVGKRRWIRRRAGVMWRWRPGRGAAADGDDEGRVDVRRRTTMRR